MKKQGNIFFYFLLMFAVLFSSCKKEEGETLALEKEEKQSSGELNILHVSPKGQTDAPHEAEKIVFIFDQAMVPLEGIPKGKGSSFLKIEPATAGKHRWKGTKVLTFTPDKRFPYASEIKVIIPAGVKSLEGHTLKQDFSWSFQTIRPKILKHFPQNLQKWVKLKPQILLSFNQPVPVIEAKEFISFIEVNKEKEEKSMNFSLKHPGTKLLEEVKMKTSSEEALLLEPKEKLNPDSTYYVELKAGFPAKEGTLGMEKNYIFSFETFKSFRFEQIKAAKPHNPYDPLEFEFSNPVKYSNFVQKIRFEPEVAIPDYYSEWIQANNKLYIYLPLQPEKEYFLGIGPELEDNFGNKLGKEVTLKFSTSSYPPSVTMSTEHGIMEAYGKLQYPLTVLNIQEALLQAAHVNADEVIPLLKTPRVFWSSEKFSYREGFFTTEKSLKFSFPRNKRRTFPVELREFLPEKYGLIFLQLDTHLPDNWERYPKALLQVTEIGISAKFSSENNLVWVTELKTGLPVNDAEVEIRDEYNKVRWRGRTDGEGKVQTPGWKPLGIKSKEKWRKPLQWIFVKQGKDVSFTSSEWGTGVYPYRFGINYDWNPQPVRTQGYVFTERGIYRAGEEVHIKGIIRRREKGRLTLPSIKEIECEILDPFSKAVYKDTLSLDSFGSFAFDFKTDEQASLGNYQIKVKVPPETKEEKSTYVPGSFRIEAFRPAEFEVHLRTQKESFIFGDDYKAEVKASYLFGGPMAGQNTSWHLRLNPTSYTPPGHRGYVFGNEIDLWAWEEREESRLIASGEGKLDSEGKLEIGHKLLPEKEKDSVQATLEATVQGPSRRSISNRIHTIVHRGEYYIGLKPSTSLLEKGSEITVNVIAVDEKGAMISEKKIEVKLLQRKWHSVRKKGIGGSFRWITHKEDTEVATLNIQSKKDPQLISFIPENSGFYLLRAEGEDNRGNKITTTTSFYATGKDYIPWERKDDDSVELVPEKQNFKPGERAKILVKSPYEKAKALVTVERELILESQIVDIQGSANQIEIPITNDYIPNIFVSVILVQGRTSPPPSDGSEDIGKPSFKIGYTTLNVDPSEKRLKIEIERDKKTYKPKDKVTLHLKVKDWEGKGTQASLCLAVVDLGVLNLIGYKTPDPFSQFYSQRPLSVATSDSRLHVIGQREFGQKGEDIGGGGEEVMKVAGLSLAEVELRGDFKSTAYWNASLLTDEKGDVSVSFELPDNLTTFRVMAVSQTKDSRFGREESTFRVSKSLLLQAALPRFARVGDTFQGGVVIHNYSSNKGEVRLSCETQGILFLDKKNIRTFPLEAGQSKEILFSFEVDKTGKARFAFRAQMGKESDGLEVFLPLKLPRSTETVALFNQSEKSVEERISIPEDIYPSESNIEVLSSATALSGLKGSIDFLTDYPYLCLEQRLSAALPFIVASDIILDFKLSKLKKNEIHNFVQKTIKEIYKYQKNNGGFALWTDSAHDSPFITCFATFALAKAQEADYKVDRARIEHVVRYLKNFLRGRLRNGNYPYSSADWKTTRAFALYCLALLNVPEPSYAEKLFVEREDLSLFGQTLLLKALYYGRGSHSAVNTLSQELMNKIKVTERTAHFEDKRGRKGRWIYSSNMRTTAFILQTMVEIGSDDPLLPSIARWLVEKRKASHWHSTQENFYVFYALNNFYRVNERIEPNFKLEISLAGKVLLKEIFQKERCEIVFAEMPLAQFKLGKNLPLKIKKKGKGIVYYGVRMTYAPRQKVQPQDEGIAIYKKIESIEGKPLDSIKAGSIVIVTLEVTLPQESLFVVVNDPLPAGFEAVNPVFLTESQEQERKLEQLEGIKLGRWWEGFSHIEMHDDRVLLFADSLSPGLHTHRYLARALNFGLFQTPGTKAEEMYSPEVFGRSSESIVKITK